MMWYEKNQKLFLCICLAFLMLAMFLIVPTYTSFYYYAWGQHLDWSYFDGPPGIALLFYLSRTLFGQTYFSINVIGLICYVSSFFYVYRLGCLLKDKRVGITSAIIWAVIPVNIENVLIRVIYDAPLNLFTIMSYYYFCKFLVSNKRLHLCLSAICIGAMIDCKYTAGVSVLAIFFYIVFSSKRVLFKQVNLYLACLLTLIIISPVIYWNAMHGWMSISYLWHFHSLSVNHVSLVHSLLRLLLTLISNYSVFLLFSMLGFVQFIKRREKNQILVFLYFILFFSVFIWILVECMGGLPRSIYFTPLSANIALTAGYSVYQFKYLHFYKRIYPIFIAIAAGMIIANCYPFVTYLDKYNEYKLVQDAIKKPGIIKKEVPIVSGSYGNAAVLDFFVGQRPIYTIPCGETNQYGLWYSHFLRLAKKHKIPEITYISTKDDMKCIQAYFDHCQTTAVLSQDILFPFIHKTRKTVKLYCYQCSNQIENVAR